MGLLDETHLPDEERYGGKAAGLMLDGSSRQMIIETDFRRDSIWFKTDEERNP